MSLVVHQLYSCQGVPQKVPGKESSPKRNFGHMIWHLKSDGGEGHLGGSWKDGHCLPVFK